MESRQGRLAALCAVAALTIGLVAASAASAATTVSGWGFNKNGQLGNGNKTASPDPVTTLIPPLDEVVEVSAGRNHSLALLSDGTVLAWGNNNDGQLGNGTTTQSLVPVAVSGLTGVKQIAAGGNFSVALLENGTAVSWGHNPEGQLGDGLTSGPETCPGGESCSKVPRPVVELTEGKQISAGDKHTAVVLANGEVVMWGPNTKDPGELGLGITTGPESCGPKNLPCSTRPRAVCHAFVKGEPEPCPEGPFLTGVVSVSVGYSHTVALLEGGTAVAWGGNSYRELGAVGPEETGKGALKDRSYVPVKVNKLSGAVAVEAGHKTSFALLSDGTVVGWGRNSNGELGLGTKGEAHEFPEKVCAVGTSGPCPTGPYLSATAVSAGAGSSPGFAHTLALLPSGEVVGWGDNGNGEVGDGTAVAKTTPQLVCALGTKGACPTGPYLTGVFGISAGAAHSAAAGH
jgi:alpha-tubulin suppressor-like RCC1 family protein